MISVTLSLFYCQYSLCKHPQIVFYLKSVIWCVVCVFLCKKWIYNLHMYISPSIIFFYGKLQSFLLLVQGQANTDAVPNRSILNGGIRARMRLRGSENTAPNSISRISTQESGSSAGKQNCLSVHKVGLCWTFFSEQSISRVWLSILVQYLKIYHLTRC